MNRRTFLQSVIAVPLVAVGMPHVWPNVPIIQPNRSPKWLIVSGGQGYEFEFGFSDETIRAMADDLARRIDEEALDAAMRFLENPTESNYWRAREAHQVPDRR